MRNRLWHMPSFFSLGSRVDFFANLPDAGSNFRGGKHVQGYFDRKRREQFSATLKDINDSLLPEGDVTVRVAYSSLNYKDSLAITGKSPVVRRFPMIPGVDLAGTVEASSNPDYQVGDSVLLNGWGLGETHWGGLAQKARIKGEWLVHLPSAFSLQQAMAIGTAGYTAMLCVLALEQHGITPDKGEIVVTGAAGGVGSVAVALLSKLGYRVVAASGRMEEADYPEGVWVPRRCWDGRNLRAPENHSGRNGGRGRSMWLAATCLRTFVPQPSTAG